jgi:hypothetical protein
MALLFSDGFDNYTAVSDVVPIGYLYSTNNGSGAIEATGSRWSGNALRLSTGNSTSWNANVTTFAHATPSNSIRVAFWMSIQSNVVLGTSAFPFRLWNAPTSPTRFWNFGITATNSLGVSVLSSSSTTAPSVSGSVVLNDGFWHHIEAHLVASQTSGTLQLWIDGASQGIISGAPTANVADTAAVLLHANLSGPQGVTNQQVRFDDLVIWDDSGTDFTGYMGPHRTRTLRPNGAGDSTQFTPSTGSNWQNVDEQVYSGTDFNDSATPGHIDLYAYGDLSPLPSSVKGVAVRSMVHNPDLGTRTFRILAKSGSTTGTGPTRTAPITPRMWMDPFGKNPATGNPWTGSELNGAQFGVEVIA